MVKNILFSPITYPLHVIMCNEYLMEKFDVFLNGTQGSELILSSLTKTPSTNLVTESTVIKIAKA